MKYPGEPRNVIDINDRLVVQRSLGRLRDEAKDSIKNDLPDNYAMGLYRAIQILREESRKQNGP